MQVDPRWPTPPPLLGAMPATTPPPVSADEARSGIGTIPYLGPEPPPSRQLGTFLRVALILGGLSALARAALYLQRASLDRRLASNPTADVVAAIRGNQDALALITIATLLLAGAVVIVNILWRRQRRPKEILNAHGEAYVESPLRQITPASARVALAVAMFIFLIGLMNSNPPTGTTVDHLAHYRDWSAVTMLALAGLWAFDYIVVVIADRHHDNRLRLSMAVRQRPETVPFIPPIKKGRTLSGNRPPRP